MLFARGGRLAGGAVAPASVIDWARLKRAFGAINNDVDSNSPDDIAYVTSGYAPTFARVVEWVCRTPLFIFVFITADIFVRILLTI